MDKISPWELLLANPTPGTPYGEERSGVNEMLAKGYLKAVKC